MAANTTINEEEDPSISRIGPWKNKEEFIDVYKWLFSSTADNITKQKACDVITVWKLRRQNLTPASVLSTLAILEVILKDDPSHTDPQSLHFLKTVYSSVFTRFINYMSSIMQSKNLKSMYLTAKELGIESFLVDLRHLCAHGQVMPSIDVFRRSAIYCLKWLKDFYWDRELNSINNATVSDVRLKSAVHFEQNIYELFKLYDAASEAIHKRCKTIFDIGAVLDADDCKILRVYAEKIMNRKLSMITTGVINELTMLASKESKVRGNAKLYCEVLFRCRYFIDTAAEYAANTSENNKKIAEFIGLHQNLFRSMAMCGFIETCFNALIEICEDEHESMKRRLGASFWANQIVTGFLIFKEFKNVYKTKKEKNSKFEMDLAPINTDIMSKDIREIYKSLGVSCSSVLIFGDTVRRPWALSFSRDYIQERIMNINEYTADIIKKCLSLMDQPLTAQQEEYLLELMKVNMSYQQCETSKSNEHDDDKIYTLSEDVLKKKNASLANHSYNEEGDKQYGVWSEVSDGVNWQSIPLGRMVWE